MKHVLKNTTALLLLVVCLSVSAAAISMHDPFSSSKNIQAYTPTTGTVTLSATSVSFSALKWSDISSFAAASYWEGEIRGNISEAYSSAPSVTGTLPSLYREYDTDDTSIGSHNAHAIVQNLKYSAKLTTVAASSFQDGIDLQFESETGLWQDAYGDGWPLYGQVHETVLNTKTNTSISW